MHWKRRRRYWPLWASLVSLFALALATPHLWRHAAEPAAQPIAASTPSTISATAEHPSDVQIVELPEAVSVEHSDSNQSVVSSAPTAPVQASEYVIEQVADTASSVPLEKQALPVREPFDIKTLHAMYDAVVSAVEQLPIPQAPALFEEPSEVPPRDTPQVVVSSPSDRLAMVVDPTERRDATNESAELSDSYSDRQEETTSGGRIPDTPEPEVEQESVGANTSAAIEDKETESAETISPTQPSQEPTESSSTAEKQAQSAESIPTDVPAEEFSLPLIQESPRGLIEQLEKIATHPESADWAKPVLADVRRLTNDSALSQEAAMEIVDQLNGAVENGLTKPLEITDLAVQQNWLRAAAGLQRRLNIWGELLTENSIDEKAVWEDVPTSTTLMPLLNELATLFSEQANGEEWRDYLLLDEIATAASEGAGVDRLGRLRLAQEVLSRLHDDQLTQEQLDFIATEPLASLKQEMRPWAAGPVDLETLLALVERYEMNGQLRYGAAIAQLLQRMQWSGNDRLEKLAKELTDSYRSANLRIALSGEMLNRILPAQKQVIAPVRERIAGKKVRGRSVTTTNVRVRLLPHEEKWSFGLEARGKVYSQTRTDTWPVWARNTARFRYEASKAISIDEEEGLAISPTRARAQGRNDLVGVDSEFDPIPILGSLLRDLARREHHKSRSLALSQVKTKVERHAAHRMDSEADPKLVRLEEKFRQQVLGPLEELALAAETVDMFTTEERAVMRLRLANLQQLAAHSPRPAAPSDSLVSLQFHETVLNNAASGLNLDGRRFTLLELYQFFAEKLGRSDTVAPTDLPQRAVIEFASHDALQVHFNDDRLELVLNIRELAHGRDNIENFRVHALYRPVLDGLEVRLVHVDTLQFSGRYLRPGPRIVLHSVMGKFFVKGQEVPIIKKELEDDSRVAGTMITQLVLDDGWIAVALGPAYEKRTAWRTPLYKLAKQDQEKVVR